MEGLGDVLTDGVGELVALALVVGVLVVVVGGVLGDSEPVACSLCLAFCCSCACRCEFP